MKRPTPSGTDRSKHYAYHKKMGHTTEECVTLKDKIEELIRARQLKKYIWVYRPQAPAERPAPRQTYRPDRSRNDRADRPRSKRRRSRSRSRSHERPLRHVRALQSVHSVDKPRRTMLPITFSDDDFHASDPDQDDPMVITTEIAKYGVSKVLVDQGSSMNILYWKTFQ
ncbi:uncharacterized protein LOC108332776 [Vigna angularis]|uniref:uncharacterized protein LOC108332776 n=1 Tax=Phaseolus angularis TaxID=3914 RepID=UPI000809BD23|nr:uncharacterized protein LOC108332776 [Vigna angularis]